MSEVEGQRRNVSSAHHDQPNRSEGGREEDAEFLPGFSGLEDYSKVLDLIFHTSINSSTVLHDVSMT